jgi:hypothetical protein
MWIYPKTNVYVKESKCLVATVAEETDYVFQSILVTYLEQMGCVYVCIFIYRQHLSLYFHVFNFFLFLYYCCTGGIL